MYALQKINPDQWEQIPILKQFYDDLPKNPYCTDEKGTCYPRHKKNAIQKAYIQPNHPQFIKWLCFDIDSENALFAYHDNHLPRPQFTARNPTNGHAHYCYRLTLPVPMWGNAHSKPIEYLQAIYRALALALGADLSYGGNLIKNPFSSLHEIYITGAKPSYTLEELAQSLDLTTPQPQPQADNDDHFGRNCATFEYTRHKAYPIADQLTSSQLFKELIAIASEYNARFDNPMLPNEVKHIAYSIAKFCKSPRFGTYSKRFIEKQRKEGRNGALVANANGANSKGGQARSATYDPKRQQAEQMHQQGVKIKEIAERLEVTRRTLSNWGIKAKK